jgi:hypothetical protein
MTHPTYAACKGMAYQVLATIASCDHPKATSQGYVDGWQMLMDKHDDSEMALFCVSLGKYLSREQCNVLFDGLAKEYTEFSNWNEFVEACADYPNWKPSREKLAEYMARTVVKTSLD